MRIVHTAVKQLCIDLSDFIKYFVNEKNKLTKDK